MPSQRYLLVEGVRDENGRGHPVTDPHNPSASPARYAGWKYAPQRDEQTGLAKEVDGIIDHYEQAQEVIADHQDLRAAIKHGHLRLVSECVAKSRDEAISKIKTPKPSAPSKPTKSAGGEK